MQDRFKEVSGGGGGGGRGGRNGGYNNGNNTAGTSGRERLVVWMAEENMKRMQLQASLRKVV
jgi:hypothetical protein